MLGLIPQSPLFTEDTPLPPKAVSRTVFFGCAYAGACAPVLAQTPELILRESQQIQVDAAPENVLSIDRLAAWGPDSCLVIATIRPWQHEKHVVWGSLNGSTPAVFGVEDGQAPGEPDHFRLRDGLNIVAPAVGSEAAVFLGDGEGEAGFLMSLRRVWVRSQEKGHPARPPIRGRSSQRPLAHETMRSGS